MLNKKLAEMNENGTLPIFKNYLANISANPTKVKSLSDFANDGWYEVTDVDGFEKYLVYHYAEGKKISVRYIFGKTPKIQEANPKGFFGEIADVISVFAYDSTLAVSKLNTEEGSAVKLVGYDTEGNLVEDTIPEGIVVDDALNTESENAIANAPVATALNEKADTADLLDGTLMPNKAVQAKSIEAVSTESGAVQDTPFIYQGTGTANGTSIADTSPVGKHLEKQGNSVVVNQWVPDSQKTFSNTSVDTRDYFDFVIQVWNNNSYIGELYHTWGEQPNGLAILLLNATGINGNRVVFKHNGSNADIIFTDFACDIGAGQKYLAILNVISNDVTTIGGLQIKDISFIKLGQWFAGNIPQDLLDHPENFPRYYNGSLAYNEGSMENGTGRYLTCGGRNVWDEEWEQGRLDNNGQPEENNNSIRSKNFNRCIPNTSYYGCIPTTYDSIYALNIFFYDKEQNYISSSYSIRNGNVVSPSNACFFKICTNSYANTYNHDITISLYYTTGDSYDQYFPYEEPKVYDTGSEVLYGIEGSRDIKTPDGTITRVRKRYKLKELNWNYTAGGDLSRFYTADLASVIKPAPNNSTKGKLICSLYSTNVSWSDFTNTGGNLALRDDGYIGIRDLSYSDVTSLVNHFTDDDYIEVELAEPTTEQGTPFAENIEINDYGTMGWDSEVPQGCKIFYPADYALFIDSVGQRQDINWDALAIVSHTELNNETNALEAKDTQLLNAVGGTLRQLLAVSKSIDFDNTDFVDLGTLNWAYDGSNNLFYVALPSAKKSDSNTTAFNGLCTKYKVTALQGVTGTRLSGLAPSMDYLIAVDSSFAADATAFKNAMKGVLLAYEKASE